MWLTILLKYFAIVVQGVVAIEAAVGAEQGKGATKKRILLDAIVAGARVGETVDEKHVAGISSLIDSVVGNLNSSGIFGGHAPTTK